jgi:CRISPR-associated protein Cas6
VEIFLIIELVFPISGTTLPTDHAYPLFAALSHLVKGFHDAESGLRFSPITGTGSSDGQLMLGESSRLCVRLRDDQIKMVLPLAGKRLGILDTNVRLGVPSVRTLIPATNLFSRITTFKNADTPEAFLNTARKKLAELGVGGEPTLPIHLEGDRAGEPRRKVIRIHDVAIVGYSLIVCELPAEHSLMLQERGLGGRTQMGCGFFVPSKEGQQ